MLMRKIKTLITTASLVAFVATPSVASERDDDGDRDHKAVSMVIGGDFDLAVLDAGMVEASFVVDAGLSVSSIEIRSEDLIFGPVQEVEPGVWIATALAPDGTNCYQAMADAVLVRMSGADHEEDEKDDDDERKSRSDDDHRKEKKSRSHDDDDDDDDHDGDEKHEASPSYALRMGASVCAPSNACAPPVRPPSEGPGPGPGLPPGVAPLPGILTPLGMYP